MDANPTEKAPKRRWRDVAALVAAIAVSLPVIRGVRALTSEQLGLAGGTLAGMICAATIGYGIMMVVNRFPDRHDSSDV